MEGFSKVVEDAWREGPCDESNAMINMMIKLKYLKTKIREWNKKNMLSAKNVKAKYKDELEALEAIIDKGDGNVEVVNKRMEVELESDVSNEEIKRAVWDCGIDKSPGPDGFTFGFYRRSWNLIENDVYDVVKYFFTYGVIPKGCNSSFIALIPKIPDANTVKDFRPISLIGSLYKIVAKILANHLVGVLRDIVNEVQSTFIVGRQILDGPFILNEYMFLNVFIGLRVLRINMSKSKIMGVLVDSDKVKYVASKLECLILKTPFSYLGSKVGGSMSRVHTWNEVVDRVKNRLSKWKMKTLSIGGRLTLLNSVLESMPIFHMSVFRALLTVLRTLESIRSQFFKRQELNSKKASWAIHGDVGKVGGYVKDGAKSCWLSIVNEINYLKNKGINSLDFMHVKLGNGDKTAFGEDIWIEGKALKNRVPRGGVEQEQFDELSALVHDVTLTPMSDRWIRALESSGDFSVASVRKVKTDSLPMRFNVSRRGAETSSHLLFLCCMARKTVHMITRWWDVPYGEVDSYEDWINWFVNLRLSYKHKQMLEGFVF
nr:RNA-directed DNA polymerase, eukaryota, reverse transcriptase zinc-binding domain protein [Tanacetum cinerariifolium]